MKNLINAKPSEIRPYLRNPRRNDEAVADVVISIKKFGFQAPIVCDENMEIIAGHTRWKAALKIGLEEVPVVITDELSEQQKIAYRIADNKSGEKAEWDTELLGMELNSLDNEYLDACLISTEELDKILNAEEEITQGLTDDDDIPEEIEPTCKTGQLYKLGEHRLLCGDATKKEDVERLMDGKISEMLFTSPPYSDMREYGGNDLSIETLINFIPAFYPSANYMVINLGIQRKNHEINEYWNLYIKKAKEIGYSFLSWNVWDRIKCGSIGHQTAMFGIEHEWLFVFGKEPKKLNRTIENNLDAYEKRHPGATKKNGFAISGGRQKDNTIKTQISITHSHKQLGTVISLYPQLARNVNSDNPAMYPVELPYEYIKAMTQPEQIIIDSFLGSGSTIIACEKTNRKCYGMEIDPHYCDVIIKRWENFTGQKAELITDQKEVVNV